MITVPRSKVIYTFGPRHKPIAHVKPGEPVSLETQDALGGQIKDEKASLHKLDWTRVNGATGPLFIEGAKPGDTLVVEILDIKIDKKGVMVVVPKSGVLKTKKFRAFTKIVNVNDGYIDFDKGVRVKANPMIGTIGVAPESDAVSSGSSGKHGGNMDVKKITAATKLYLPVSVDGALFAAGDLHAAQADGELCVSSVEVAGEIVLKFDVRKGNRPEWPILESHDSYAVLACGDTLDEAAKFAASSAVKALMREHNWPFEKVYMFGSLTVDLEINQVVDPKKGARAVISKDFVSLDSFLTS